MEAVALRLHAVLLTGDQSLPKPLLMRQEDGILNAAAVHVGPGTCPQLSALNGAPGATVSGRSRLKLLRIDTEGQQYQCMMAYARWVASVGCTHYRSHTTAVMSSFMRNAPLRRYGQLL